jgi:hypothetical protein
MSLNGIGQSYNAAAGYKPPKPTKTEAPGFLGLRSTFNRLTDTTGQSSSNTSTLSVLHDKTVFLSARNIMEEAINKVGSFRAPSARVVTELADDFAEAGVPLTGKAVTETHSYSNLFHLKQEQLALKDGLSWDRYKQTVRNNFEDFGKQVKRSGSVKEFFGGMTLKEHLAFSWKNNIEPFKDAIQNTSKATVTAGVAQGAGVGLMGWDIFKNTRTVYKDSKAKEDGSLRSELNTMKDTGLAFAQYATRSVVSWEVAGRAMAFGRNLLPYTVCRLPVGGILGGAIGGALAYKGMSKVLGLEHKQSQTPVNTVPSTTTENPFKNVALG